MKKYQKKTATRKTVEIPIYTLWEDPQHVFTDEKRNPTTKLDFGTTSNLTTMGKEVRYA